MEKIQVVFAAVVIEFVVVVVVVSGADVASGLSCSSALEVVKGASDGFDAAAALVAGDDVVGGDVACVVGGPIVCEPQYSHLPSRSHILASAVVSLSWGDSRRNNQSCLNWGRQRKSFY